jgi:DNA-directed RNA polymerase subunit RPC12/RpoP
MTHAANNATFECASCGKEFWTDDEPTRCTACRSFTIVRRVSPVPHIEHVAAMVNQPQKVQAPATPEPQHKEIPVSKRSCIVTDASGASVTYETTAEAAKAIGCQESSLKVAMAPSASGAIMGHKVKWGDESKGRVKPRAPRVTRKKRVLTVQPVRVDLHSGDLEIPCVSIDAAKSLIATLSEFARKPAGKVTVIAEVGERVVRMPVMCEATKS